MEITDQQLLNAGLDADTFAAVINGPANGADSTVATRTGPIVPTLAKCMADAAVALSQVTLIDTVDGSHWQLQITGGAPVWTKV
jgi:hypothetical protein